MKILMAMVLFGISTLSFAHQYHAHHDEKKGQHDTERMEQVRQLMEKARRESNEQYYLQASQLLDDIKKSTLQKKIFRAEIQQYFHHFDQALKTLSDVNNTASTDLLHASIYFTQGKFEQAHQHCKKLFGQVDHLLALTCIAQANSLLGELEKAYRTLSAAIKHVPSESNQSLAWAYVTLAEMSERKADYQSAKEFYQKSLQINHTDMPTRIAYADILLQEKNSLKTIELTRDYLHNDLLRLRYVRAIQLYGNNDDDHELKKLKKRIEHYTEENQHLHFDLLAEYNLYFQNDTEQSLQWAKRHWQQQKTPRDARLLAMVARMQGDAEAMQWVKDWRQQHNLEDVGLDNLITNNLFSLR